MIYYKETNPHRYLDYHSAHPSHIKQTIPFNLAKRIIVFVSDPDLIEMRLKELEKWLIDCNYPKSVIKQAFHRAKLQGPAPDKSDKHKLPLVTTHYPDLQFSQFSERVAEWLRRLTRKPKVRTAVGSNPTLDSLVAVRNTSPGRPEPCEGNLVAVAGSCGGLMVKHPWPLLEISLSDFRGLATLNINTYLPVT